MRTHPQLQKGKSYSYQSYIKKIPWSHIPPTRKEKIFLDGVGIDLKKKRLEHKLSSNDLSRLTGLSERCIRKIECNDCNATLISIYRMCKALNFPIEKLFSNA